MNKKELATKLNGRESGNEISTTEEESAKNSGLVVIFGYSDDNMEIRGVVNEEIGTYNGGEAYFTNQGLLENDCDNEDCPHFEKLKEKSTKVEALWDTDGYSWIYKINIPHATFEIMEDGEKYCRGIVFSLADIKEEE